jgi:Arc/MetJ-type ribon-helix-helix transcriptional regulator
MHAQKLSISLPQEQYDFIAGYQAEHHYKTRSEVRYIYYSKCNLNLVI